MLKELLKLLASALAAAGVIVMEKLKAGEPLSGKLVLSIVLGTVVARLALWLVSLFPPAPAPST